jgi:hypothetical protein
MTPLDLIAPLISPALNVLWVVALVCLIWLGVLGFASRSRGHRLWIALGAMSAALIATAQGLIYFAPMFWVLPIGLYPGLLDVLGWDVDRSNMPPAWVFLTVWGCYLALIAGFALANNLWIARVFWGSLLALLIANIAGCHPSISTLKGIP